MTDKMISDTHISIVVTFLLYMLHANTDGKCDCELNEKAITSMATGYLFLYGMPFVLLC